MLLSAAHCVLIHQIGTEIGWCIQKKVMFSCVGAVCADEEAKLHC